jgi:hypothetical protein
VGIDYEDEKVEGKGINLQALVYGMKVYKYCEERGAMRKIIYANNTLHFISLLQIHKKETYLTKLSSLYILYGHNGSSNPLSGVME